MPSQIGTDLGIDLPTPGGDTGVWGTNLNTELQKVIDAIEGGTQTSVGLTVDAAIPLAGYDLEDAGALFFRNKSGAFATASCVYERSGELYFNDSSGNQVKLTAGGSINAAGVAGIGGDYGGSDPAAATYNAANSKFVLVSDPNVPASLEVGTLRIGRSGETSPNIITFQSPASLSAGYTITLPAAVSAANGSLVTMSTAGVLSTTMAPSVTSVTATGTISGGVVTTAEAGPRHGSRVIHWTPFDARNYNGGTQGTITHNGTGAFVAGNTGVTWAIPVMVPVGSRITAYGAYLIDSGGGSTVDLWKLTLASAAAQSQVGSTQTSAADAAHQIVFEASLTETVAAGYTYFIKVTALTTGDALYGGYYIYDRVA